MASNYKTPGVYVEEISKLPASVAAVETAIPAFIGYTQKARKKVADDLINLPQRITSLLEYEQFFGGPENETGITVTFDEQVDGDGNVISREVNAAIDTPSNHNMYYAVEAFYANGGGPCYIISSGLTSAAAGVILDSALAASLAEAEKVDEITLLLFPEAQAIGDMSTIAGLYGAALDQGGKLQDRFVIMDLLPPGNTETILDAATTFRGASLPIGNLKYGAIYAPNVDTIFNYAYQDADVTIVQNQTDPTGATSAGPDAGTMDALAPSDADPSAGNAILYNLSKAAIDAIPMRMPPSPLVAGQYAKTDNARGVWKAPANVALSAVIEPAVMITSAQQEGLNVDTSGKSINAIRSFAGKGTLIWGARTLAGNDNEWRYVPVRRFFNFAEESIKKATERYVFEPNDANTWTKVRAMIENFLILQWRAGALQGAKPEQAFFVNVGLGTTMTALDILEGRMIVEIGMAVVRPAEFIILRFSHKMAEA
jgi:uncharacterized protein